MKCNEILKDLIGRNGYSYTTFADARGVTRSMVCNVSRSRNMRTDTVIDYLGFLGYKLVAVPKAFNVPEGAYELTPSNDPIDDRRTGSHVRIHGGDSDELIG